MWRDRTQLNSYPTINPCLNKNAIIAFLSASVIVISADLIAASMDKGKIFFTANRLPLITHFAQQPMNWGLVHPKAGTIIGSLFTLIALYCLRISLFASSNPPRPQNKPIMREQFQFLPK